MYKIFLLLIFTLLFKQNLFGQRVPLEEDGDYLLYKSDSVIVTYYWVGERPIWARATEGKYAMPLSYALFLNVKNILKDTIYFKFKLKTIESNPIEYISNEYADNVCSQGDPYSYILYSESKEIVDFKFKQFNIKFKSGKVLDLTKSINSLKQSGNPLKHLIKPVKDIQ